MSPFDALDFAAAVDAFLAALDAACEAAFVAFALAGAATAVRPLDAPDAIDGLVRKHFAAALALLLPGPERSPNVESTAAPWWAILDPGRGRGRRASDIAGAITGPFLTREAAEDYLDDNRHNYGPSAAVWCLSGHASPEWCALPVTAKGAR